MSFQLPEELACRLREEVAGAACAPENFGPEVSSDAGRVATLAAPLPGDAGEEPSSATIPFPQAFAPEAAASPAETEAAVSATEAEGLGRTATPEEDAEAERVQKKESLVSADLAVAAMGADNAGDAAPGDCLTHASSEVEHLRLQVASLQADIFRLEQLLQERSGRQTTVSSLAGSRAQEDAQRLASLNARVAQEDTKFRDLCCRLLDAKENFAGDVRVYKARDHACIIAHHRTGGDEGVQTSSGRFA